MKTKRIAQIGVIAALYAVLTIAIAPIGYGAIQFRLAEILKPLALKSKWYIAALTIGLFMANLFSPYAGAWELIFMPVACLSGGIVANYLKKLPVLANTIYALWISAAVALMLLFVAKLPFLLSFLTVGVSEVILLNVGWIIIANLFRSSKIAGIAID
jgi:uncharacterized membrane protein